MDLFRQTSKLVRMVAMHSLYTQMTEGKGSFEKCMMGNIFALRQAKAIEELHLLRRHSPERYTRSEDQLYLFNEMFGAPGTTFDFERSELLDEAATWLLDNDIHGSFEMLNLKYRYRDDDWGSLPLITGFTLKGSRMLTELSQTFSLKEVKHEENSTPNGG